MKNMEFLIHTYYIHEYFYFILFFFFLMYMPYSWKYVYWKILFISTKYDTDESAQWEQIHIFYKKMFTFREWVRISGDKFFSYQWWWTMDRNSLSRDVLRPVLPDRHWGSECRRQDGGCILSTPPLRLLCQTCALHCNWSRLPFETNALKSAKKIPVSHRILKIKSSILFSRTVFFSMSRGDFINKKKTV